MAKVHAQHRLGCSEGYGCELQQERIVLKVQVEMTQISIEFDAHSSRIDSFDEAGKQECTRQQKDADADQPEGDD